MRDVTVELAKTLKTKQVFNVHYKGKDMGFVGREKYTNGVVRWYPFYVNPNTSKAFPRYTSIRYVECRDNKVPAAGFPRNPSTGYRFTPTNGINNFIKFIDNNSKIKAVVFNKDKTILRSNGILEIKFSDFGMIHYRVKAFYENKRSEENNLSQSLLNKLLPKDYKQPTKIMLFGGHLGSLLNKYSIDSFKPSEDEIELLRSMLLDSGLSSELIVSTKLEIDRVYIEDMLVQFKELMKIKNDSKTLEEKWHKFFKKHTWIFSQIFAFPAIYFDDKVNVGGKDFSGGTDKIIDFLYKNELTDNLAFIEIKTHRTKLVNGTPYRKPDIYSVSKDVSGAMVQVLDQRTKLLQNYHTRKGGSDTKSLNSTCLVVAGSMKMLKVKEKKESFELFRSGNRDVIIVTFDELLKKITTLLAIFTKKPGP